MNFKKIISTLLYFSLHMHATSDTIAPGVRYQHITTVKPSQSLHLLTVDPQQAHITLGIANDKCASAQKTSVIAKNNNAIAAINGGFFDFGCKTKWGTMAVNFFDCLGYSRYNAFPVYTLQCNNNYYSLSDNFTGAISWNNDDMRPSFDTIKTKITVTIHDQQYLVDKFNKPHPQKPTLYSAVYDRKTPYFERSVDEIIIKNNCIYKIYKKSHGKKTIPKNGWVYVIPKKYTCLTNSLKTGDPVIINITHYQKTDFEPCNEIWHNKDNILASTPLLLYNSQILKHITDSTSQFYAAQQPRSAVGLLANGHWIFVVADGRQKQSKGLTMLELAKLMKKLGCTDALNLDGGGSSTMVIKNKAVNSVSGQKYSLFRKERPVSNAILVLPK